MDDAKLRGAVGLAMRAGGCRSGDFIVEKLVRSGEARLVLIDSLASDNTRERYRAACASRGIPVLEMKDLGSAIGKAGRMVAAVTDERFIKLIGEAGSPKQDETNAGV